MTRERKRQANPAGAPCPKGASCGGAYLVGALHTPHIGTLPPDVAVLTVIIAVFLLQELNKKDIRVLTNVISSCYPSFQKLRIYFMLKIGSFIHLVEDSRVRLEVGRNEVSKWPN